MEKQIEEMAKVICGVIDCKNCVHRFEVRKCGAMRYAEELYNAGYHKQREGEWVISENGCVITCSECGYRLELCYPDGTEVRSLPACPNCGTKMKGDMEC